MGRPLEKLSAIEVERKSRKLPAGRTKATYADGGGLYLRVGQARSEDSPPDCSWLFRFMLDGKSREMGLGPYPDISLQRAREKAQEARRLKLEGRDPIVARETARAAAKLEAARAITFKGAAERFIAAHKVAWKNEKHIDQWSSTLTTYVYPAFGQVSVADVDVALVMKVLEPIWTAKGETAGRVRGRIERILDWATARGLRVGENPARWRGHLDKLLPAQSKVRSVKHHAALPYVELPAFMSKLTAHEGAAALALRFTILTAARTGEAIGATWKEIDLDNAVWTIPGSRMKAGKEHRVPLSKPALSLLREKHKATDGEGFVFPGAKRGRPLSNMAMLELLRGMEIDATPHGFRSSFRDWAAEQTTFAREVAEAALAHTIENKVEAAYRRTDLFEKRRKLMNAWATFATTPAADGEKVVSIKSARSSG